MSGKRRDQRTGMPEFPTGNLIVDHTFLHHERGVYLDPCPHCPPTRSEQCKHSWHGKRERTADGEWVVTEWRCLLCGQTAPVSTTS